jgi:DNA-binding LacI/PurR family transcriptional regulator
MRDVARRAGVSPATVSRSLRGISNVSPETRERVLQAATDLAYVRPHPVQYVGVLAQYPAHWFHASAIAAAERVVRRSNRSLVLHSIGDAEARRHLFDEVAPRHQFDAILVVSSSFTDAEQEALRKLDVPICVVGGHLPGWPRVGIDDRASAAMAVQHLVGLGHRDIGLIALEPHSAVGVETTAARRAGFDEALTRAGLEQRPEWIVAGTSNVTGGILAAERLLTQPKLPTALFAMSDEMALGALQTLRRAGIRVPAQMSVIGFDDHEMAPCGDLTTIAQPVEIQATMATTLLLDQLEGKASTGPREITLRTRLVVRGSTGPPPG